MHLHVSREGDAQDGRGPGVVQLESVTGAGDQRAQRRDQLALVGRGRWVLAWGRTGHGDVVAFFFSSCFLQCFSSLSLSLSLSLFAIGNMLDGDVSQ